MSNHRQPYNTDLCTDVTENCPVEATIYGYYPSMGANAFFAAFFGACLLVQLGQGIRYRTWFYSTGMLLGCLTETVGYIGRIIMNDNPWSSIGFNMQICCLIIAPAFFSASIYVTLKNIVLTLGTEYSRLRPTFYTWIFIAADLLSLILQGAGGGLAASGEDQTTIDLGSNLMLAGIVWQVVSLTAFAALAIEYLVRVYRNRQFLSPEASAVASATKTKLCGAAIGAAFLTIFVRCIYRIPEMSGGWRNEIMQNELEFIVLEGVMIVIAAGLLTALHPGHFCPSIVGKGETKFASPIEKVVGMESDSTTSMNV